MAAIHFEDELRKLLQEEEARLTGNLVGGMAIADFPEYRHQVGQIAGVRRALDLFEDARKSAAER